jgi:hypothetical protein
MTWVESSSASFRARHDAAAAEDAERVLASLEETRARLIRLFPRLPDEVTVVLHEGAAGLAFTNPLLPLAWLGTAPAARRYVIGWDGRREIHMLAPRLLQARASNVPGSREMLEAGASCLYARRAIITSNRDLARVVPVLRMRRQLRWAWLLEGAARWFGGQTFYARAAIARRLREGGRPGFPPSPRDAPLLGGTVIDLLVREQGAPAAAQLACRFPAAGPRTALADAFGGRSLKQTEDAWRSHLTRLSGGY